MDTMHAVTFWLAALLASFPGIAVLLVMLGQPVRPVGHLLKATGFWYLVSWVLLAVALVVL